MKRIASFSGSTMSALAIVIGATFAPVGSSSAVTVPSASPSAFTTGATVPSTTDALAANRTVGALFASTKTTGSHCTASVVDSAKGDLLITAAHCISGSAVGKVFVPDYGSGSEPYGSWSVVAAYGAPGWITGNDTQDDFAFLVVAPKTVDGEQVEIQDLTGGDVLASAPASGQDVTVTAYNDGSANPVTCTTPVARVGGFLAFTCGNYVDGTSGAPWLIDTADGDEVVGVIGGLHQGGCYPDTSYSSAFGATVEHTYTAAIDGARPDTFPSAGSDGCTRFFRRLPEAITAARWRTSSWSHPG